MTPDELFSARKKIGDELFKKRTSKNINKSDFCRASGLNRMTIETIESGAKSYTIDSLIIYREAVEVLQRKTFIKKSYQRSNVQFE